MNWQITLGYPHFLMIRIMNHHTKTDDFKDITGKDWRQIYQDKESLIIFTKIYKRI